MADTFMTDIVAQATRRQSLVLTGFAYTCIVFGLAIGVLVGVIPAKPGEKTTMMVMASLGGCFVLGGIWMKGWVAAKISRIRTAFLDQPATLADVKVVTSNVNGRRFYAVHAKTRQGETVGLSVPSQAAAQEVVARLQEAQPVP